MIGERVFVYWNLHRKCWSLRSCKTRRVIGHADILFMRDCKFKVSEAGRQRVLREQRKNVHAGVEGTIVSMNTKYDISGLQPVAYNPYKWPKFIWRSNEEPVESAKYVSLNWYGKVRAG